MSLEINIQIAEKIMKQKVVKTVWGKNKQYYHHSIGEPDYYDDCGAMILSNPLPNYCEDLASAMEVFEKLRKSHEYCCLTIKSDYCYNWDIVLTKAVPWPKKGETQEERALIPHVGKLMASEESLPMAICLAALKTLEEV